MADKENRANRADEQRIDDKDGRLVTGGSATRSNVGPDRRGDLETEEMDALSGTTSDVGGQPHKKPEKGSKLSGDV